MSHERAVSLALRANDDLGRLFSRLGGSEHPRGLVMRAYRVARAALRGQMSNRALVVAVLGELRASVRRAAREVASEAAVLGAEQARANLALLDLQAAFVPQDTDEAVTAWLAPLDTQIAAVRAFVATGDADETVILGDGDSAGALTPGPVLRDGARWAAELAALGFRAVADGVAASGRGPRLYKQAVAAIDKRTTDCCLRVHGQVQPLDQPFELRGRPRFADRQDWSPFHHYCRTSIALVPEAWAADQLTQAMVADSRAALRNRAKDRGAESGG